MKSSNRHPFIERDIHVQPTLSGLLKGKTFAVKDVFSVRGHTNSAGNPDWLRTHEIATRHAKVIEQLLDKGAELQGMTLTDELMFSLSGENIHYVTPLNPLAPGRIPGGSSSGSASAVASGFVDFALGTDTAGSVRIPAAYCGIIGFRPSHGAVALEGVIPLAPSFDTVGWMARDTETLLHVGKVLLSSKTASPRFSRVLFDQEAWAMTEPGYLETMTHHLHRLENLFPCEWMTVASEGLPTWVSSFRTVQGYEIWREHSNWIQQTQPDFDPAIKERFDWASSIQQADYIQQSIKKNQIQQAVQELLGEDTILILPTAPGPAPFPGEDGHYRSRILQLGCIAGLAGLPQITLPLGQLDGCPIGLSILAGRGQDLKLLEWSHELFQEYLQPICIQ
ncbi:amidase [Paenibacillus qinlingensis]|uniref:amidase n=1 Tax=Paenibacillus qinlingensis TaxID=1837343 RepID=UPI001565E675|nr:amidase [Paenibacillus qinlingensis]NQX62584.1 amidase [Paenibacillus qinlingensis]